MCDFEAFFRHPAESNPFGSYEADLKAIFQAAA